MIVKRSQNMYAAVRQRITEIFQFIVVKFLDS